MSLQTRSWRGRSSQKLWNVVKGLNSTEGWLWRSNAPKRPRKLYLQLLLDFFHSIPKVVKLHFFGSRNSNDCYFSVLRFQDHKLFFNLFTATTTFFIFRIQEQITSHPWPQSINISTANRHSWAPWASHLIPSSQISGLVIRRKLTLTYVVEILTTTSKTRFSIPVTQYPFPSKNGSNNKEVLFKNTAKIRLKF